MDRPLEGQMTGGTDHWTDGSLERRTTGGTDGWRDGPLERWTTGGTDDWWDGPLEGRMNGEIDDWRDRGMLCWKKMGGGGGNHIQPFKSDGLFHLRPLRGDQQQSSPDEGFPLHLTANTSATVALAC
ncbi:hypothetical protein D4764_16G0000280 [Takifugu flavidus]|uniref:Uncharacterized protein n=1 Tax=Takifugu flavidus TaxID=433684 RepID=A0A5C6NY09_9TELE|nr:hypothetical protein D4764_16G0000280 [Takifugu flavidus]